MANQKKAKNNNMFSIDTIDGNIVCKETNIQISDEKLKGYLKDAYETARRDGRGFKIYKLYSILLSIASTLFITLLTSDFKDLGRISSSTLSIIGWIIMVFTFIVGVALAIINSSKNGENETTERDEAVNRIINEIKN